MRPLAILAFGVALVGLSACKEEIPPIPSRPVLAMTIEPVAMKTFGPFAGTIEARYQSQLGFQTAGRMIARDVYVGDTVREGQRLAALDATVPQFALARSKADVADAKAQLANAAGIAGRQQTLAEGGNAPRAALDNAVAGRDTAKARLEQAQAALRMAEDQIGYTELHASFDGVVTAWSAEVGQYVGNGQGVVTIARPDIREAVVDIPDDLMFQVVPNLEFVVRLASSPGITATGRVREIGPLADAVTRSHRVRMTLVDPSPAFRIGTTIAVAMEQAVAPRILVPAAAVVSEGEKRFVWVVSADGTRVTRRDIAIAGSEGDKLVVASGLTDGDRIVLVGVHSLKEGQAIAGVVGRASKAKGTSL